MFGDYPVFCAGEERIADNEDIPVTENVVYMELKVRRM